MGDTETININQVEWEIGTACLICGNTVPCSRMEQEAMRYGHSVLKVCDECKKAIEWAKEKMKDRKE